MNKKDTILASVLGIAATAALTVTVKLTLLQQRFADVDFKSFDSSICGDETPSLLGLIDFSSAPGLLFYAYMPMAFVALCFAIVLVQRKNKSPKNAALAAALGFFVLWIACVLLTWLASYHVVLMFAWQAIAIMEMGIFLCAFYFAYIFITDKDLPFWGKAVLSTVGLAVLALTPTVLNVSTYDPEICEGTDGPMWKILYLVVQPAIIVSLIVVGIRAIRKSELPANRRQIALFTASFAFFMAAFAAANAIGEFTDDYELHFWGPLGLLVSFLMSGYMSMKRLRFHWHTVVAEALVWGLVTIIGTQFFYITETTPFALNSAAFLATIVFGLMMIRSATVEIIQKETEESLVRQRESIGLLATHKLKDALTRNKFTLAEFGSNPLSTDEMRQKAQQSYALADDALASIGEVLNAESLKSKAVTLDLNSVDFKQTVLATVLQSKAAADKKGLTIETEIEEANFLVLGDAHWLQEMARVFIDNAVHYTAAGTITVGLQRRSGYALFWVKDTGARISETDKAVLFTEGGHGKNAASINPDSLGFGLYTAKLIVDAHRGRTWAESRHGHGATFFVELPLLS